MDIDKQLKIPKIPKIPQTLVIHPKISLVLFHVITEFNYEEQNAIYLFCLEEIPIKKIEVLTGMTKRRIESTLMLYAERLAIKLEIFCKAIDCKGDDMLSAGCLLESEFEKYVAV